MSAPEHTFAKKFLEVNHPPSRPLFYHLARTNIFILYQRTKKTTTEQQNTRWHNSIDFLSLFHSHSHSLSFYDQIFSLLCIPFSLVKMEIYSSIGLYHFERERESPKEIIYKLWEKCFFWKQSKTKEEKKSRKCKLDSGKNGCSLFVLWFSFFKSPLCCLSLPENVFNTLFTH